MSEIAAIMHNVNISCSLATPVIFSLYFWTPKKQFEKGLWPHKVSGE